MLNLGHWSRRLVVRTPGFHPGNRGFDSHRDHQIDD